MGTGFKVIGRLTGCTLVLNSGGFLQKQSDNKNNLLVIEDDAGMKTIVDKEDFGKLIRDNLILSEIPIKTFMGKLTKKSVIIINSLPWESLTEFMYHVHNDWCILAQENINKLSDSNGRAALNAAYKILNEGNIMSDSLLYTRMILEINKSAKSKHFSNKEKEEITQKKLYTLLVNKFPNTTGTLDQVYRYISLNYSQYARAISN